MRSVEPYLIFNGNCKEAFAFYETVFEVNAAFTSRYIDLPQNERANIAEKDMDRIVHIILPVSDKVSLMGADAPSNMPTVVGENVSLTLNTGSSAEAKRIFEQLSAGGDVKMPLQKTFWAELYAMFTDKFGIHWMINYIPENE